jgi:hypothetical protein
VGFLLLLTVAVWWDHSSQTTNNFTIIRSINRIGGYVVFERVLCGLILPYGAQNK